MNYQEAIKGYTGVIQAYALAARTADKLGEDAWAVLVREVQAALKSGKTRDQIMEDMKVAEDTWKASTGDTAMPSTYRSAKAVCLKAVAADVPIVDADGNPQGKTAVEKAYKAKAEAEAPAKEPKDPYQVACGAVAVIYKVWADLDPSQRANIKHSINTLS